MIVDALPDIPRLHTALAEWGACAIYILALTRRIGIFPLIAGLGASLAALVALQLAAGGLPISMWIPGMLLSVAVMYASLLTLLDVSALAAVYLVARAFVLAELVASLHWQLSSFFFPENHAAAPVIETLFLVAVYGGMFGLAWFAERRHFPRGVRLVAGGREVIAAVAIALATFGVSNLSFLSAVTPFSGRLGFETFYIRTLVDLCGFIALYAQQEQRRELELRAENNAMMAMLQSQHDQYLRAKHSIDELNRRYHDMKHQIDTIRQEKDPTRKALYLDELEGSIQGYGDQLRTGNAVLDTILAGKRMHAREHDIELSCVADGRLLDFVGVLDLCSIVGNALDNAIESTSRVVDSEGRRVRVSLFAQDAFVMLRFENTYDGVLHREHGQIVTRKRDRARHGYGLRNIQAAAEKYGGTVSIEADGTWFSLRILLPRVSE